MMKKAYIGIGTLVIALVLFTGCTGTPHEVAQYSVNSSGFLSLRCPAVQVTENVLETTQNITVSRLVFHTPSGEVYALLASPGTPKAGFVHAPGAGVKKEGHKDRAVAYAMRGYAYLVLDIRGHSGETPGYPMDIERDFSLYQKGEFPEFYLNVCDMINAGQYLLSRYQVPVCYSGESNGGRYAAIAAAIDPQSAGYIGISTSGFGRAGDNPKFNTEARKFLLSIDPDVYILGISPRPVYIFHASKDPIIPFEDGRELYERAGEGRKFFPFNGTHGVNGEVDQIVWSEYAQIYG